MARWWMMLALVGCGADQPRESRRAIVPVAVDAPVDTVTVVEPPAVVDAGQATPCFCFSWVHLDQNGQSCFATKATCDAEFKSFGRNDKIPCGQETEQCGSYACRNLGKECFAL